MSLDGPHTPLWKNLDVLRAARLETLAMVAGLKQQNLDFRPDPRKWSIGEVLDHLLLFDRFLSQNIKQLINAERLGEPTVIRHSFTDVDVTPAFFPRLLLPLVEIPLSLSSMFVPSSVRDALVRSRLLRFQHPEVADPRPGRSSDELRQELQLSLETIEQLLFDNTDIDFRRLRVQYPLLGDNSVLQLLRFMAAHEQRHQGQIEDLKRRLHVDRHACERTIV